MIGISWGGFNGLQVAARRPPALKAVITLCSTDDRYADDVHFMGGCLLNDNLGWGSTMLGHQCRRRPTRRWSASAGATMWLERLRERAAAGRRLAAASAPRRLSGSTARSARTTAPSTAPVYAVGGWADGYSQRRPAPARRSHRCRARAWSAPGRTSYPHFARARPGDRLPAGMPALVGPVAEGHRDRDHGRADAARLDAGLGAAAALQLRAAGPLGGGGCWPSPRIAPRTVGLGAREAAPRYRRGGRAGDPLAARDRARRRPLVPLRRGARTSPATSARTTASSLVFDTAPLDEAARDPGRARRRARGRGRPAESRWWRCG